MRGVPIKEMVPRVNIQQILWCHTQKMLFTIISHNVNEIIEWQICVFYMTPPQNFYIWFCVLFCKWCRFVCMHADILQDIFRMLKIYSCYKIYSRYKIIKIVALKYHMHLLLKYNYYNIRKIIVIIIFLTT